MKILAIAAAGVLACAAASPSFAQTAAPASTEIPAPKCGTPPTLPGEKMMEDSTIRRRFEREIKTYGDCVKAYVSERQAAANALQAQAKAHADAANVAINDYNALMKKINEQAGGK
jgi:hypothetical protein